MLERAGLKVFIRDLGPQAPWAMFVPKGELKVVLLNSYLYEAHLRAAAAHELGHKAFDHGPHLDDAATVATDDGRGGVVSTDLVEQEANAFARWFLLPLAGLKKAIENSTIDATLVSKLASQFGTTYGLVALQLLKTQLIDVPARRQLLLKKETDIAGDLRSKRDVAFPEDYLTLALKAYGRSKITFERLAQLVALNKPEETRFLRELLEERKLLQPEDRESSTSVEGPVS